MVRRAPDRLRPAAGRGRHIGGGCAGEDRGLTESVQRRAAARPAWDLGAGDLRARPGRDLHQRRGRTRGRRTNLRSSHSGWNGNAGKFGRHEKLLAIGGVYSRLCGEAARREATDRGGHGAHLRDRVSGMEPRGEKRTERPDVSVIMVNWNCADVLLDCLRCLENGALEGLSHEILVVDNASTDGSVATLRRGAPGVRLLLNQRNVGFGAANNQAMRMARGRYLLLLNPDALPGAGTISRMVQVLEGRPSIGLAGCHLVDRDGKTQKCVWYEYAGHPFPVTPAGDDHDPDVVAAGWTSGACMLVRREVFAATGGFDPALVLYGEDPEWCYRIWQAGWRVAYLPGIKIVHLGGASSSRADQAELFCHFVRGQWFFRRKHLPPLRVLAEQTRTALRAWRGLIWYGALAQICPKERWRVKYRRDRDRLAVLGSWKMWWPLPGWGRRAWARARATPSQPPEKGLGGPRE